MTTAFITGLAGSALLSDEAAFLRDAQPSGIILFSRNCESHDQIRRLVGDARSAIGSERVLVLIDQEGGRVQRLRPPLGRTLPPGAAYGALYAESPMRAMRAAERIARLMADDLKALGINTDCAPVVDVPVPGAHDIIGDRALGHHPEQVTDLAGAICCGFTQGGMLPVIKHIPGHGRAKADSHLALPVVDTARDELSRSDFASFRELMVWFNRPASPALAGMTAHVVFTAIDADNPASTSAAVHRDVIRGEIGFDGLLMSDDLGMKALSGHMQQRAAAVIAAGSDLALHCSGTLSEMRDVASGVPSLGGPSLRRFEAAFATLGRNEPFDRAAAEQALAEVVAYGARIA